MLKRNCFRLSTYLYSPVRFIAAKRGVLNMSQYNNRSGEDISTPQAGVVSPGGVQLVLEASGIPATGGSVRSVEAEQLEAARAIVQQRLEIIGIASASVEVTGSTGLLVSLPGIANTDEVKQILTRRGLIEFVDGSSNPLEPGVYIVTEAGGPFPEQLLAGPPGQALSVVLNNDDLLAGGVSAMTNGVSYEVYLKLTGEGKQKLADFTRAQIGSYMPVALDKRVLFSPVIRDAITGDTVAIFGIGENELKSIVACLGSGVLPVNLAVANGGKT